MPNTRRPVGSLSLTRTGCSSRHGTHHVAQKLTTETSPCARSKLVKPATGWPAPSVKPSIGLSSVGGAILPIKADGSLEGSPARRAKTKRAARTMKIASGQMSARGRPRAGLAADRCCIAPSWRALSLPALCSKARAGGLSALGLAIGDHGEDLDFAIGEQVADHRAEVLEMLALLVRFDGLVVFVDLEHHEAGWRLGILHHIELQAARLVGEAALGLRRHLLLEFGFLAGLGRQIREDGAHGFLRGEGAGSPTLARMLANVSRASRRANRSLP